MWWHERIPWLVQNRVHSKKWVPVVISPVDYDRRSSCGHDPVAWSNGAPMSCHCPSRHRPLHLFCSVFSTQYFVPMTNGCCNGRTRAWKPRGMRRAAEEPASERAKARNQGNIIGLDFSFVSFLCFLFYSLEFAVARDGAIGRLCLAVPHGIRWSTYVSSPRSILPHGTIVIDKTSLWFLCGTRSRDSTDMSQVFTDYRFHDGRLTLILILILWTSTCLFGCLIIHA